MNACVLPAQPTVSDSSLVPSRLSRSRPLTGDGSSAGPSGPCSSETVNSGSRGPCSIDASLCDRHGGGDADAVVGSQRRALGDDPAALHDDVDIQHEASYGLSGRARTPCPDAPAGRRSARSRPSVAGMRTTTLPSSSTAVSKPRPAAQPRTWSRTRLPASAVARSASTPRIDPKLLRARGLQGALSEVSAAPTKRRPIPVPAARSPRCAPRRTSRCDR